MSRALSRLRRLDAAQRSLLLLVLPVAALAHGVGMFRYPYYENDEATYLSQAWSVLHGGLAPYTYWYDHAPAGWLQLAGWEQLVGFFSFGSSVNSGRVFMLLLHLLSVVLLFRITRRLTGSVAAATAAALLLACTPIGIYYMRRVLLDNIMLVWLLLALDLAIHSRGRLWRLVGAGAALGIAVLSKETALLFVPVVIALVWRHSAGWQRRFAVGLSVVSFVGVAGYYPLMAVIRGELLPAGSFGNTGNAHVSLITTFLWQLGRSGNGILDPATSSFWHAFHRWWELDPVFLLAGTTAVLLNVALAVRRPDARWALAITLPLIAYLLRGGLVIDFYITPLLPLLALNLGVVVGWAAEQGRALRTMRVLRPVRSTMLPAASGSSLVGVVLLAGSMSAWLAGVSSQRSVQLLFTGDQTGPQQTAIAAIRSLPPSSSIAMDNYGWLDLQHPSSGAAMPNAHYYEKVQADPDVRSTALHDNPGALDYVLVTPQVNQDLNAGNLPFLSKALDESQVVRRWGKDNYGLELWQVRDPGHIVGLAWASYRTTFIHADGRVVDTQPNGEVTTSEGQAYALLRAVWMDDRTTFDRVWAWTADHLIRPDGLLSSRYGVGPGGAPMIVDPNSASDADEDTALALLFAGRHWGDAALVDAGRSMAGAVWNGEVASAAGVPYLVAGNWASSRADRLIINPSYMAPYAYRVFAAVDPAHPWARLVDSAYALIDGDASSGGLGSDTHPYLPTEWVAVDRATGALGPADDVTGGGSGWFSFNAMRVPWRLGVDLAWNGDPRAQTILARMTLPLDEYRRTGSIETTHARDGSVIDHYESRSVVAAVLPALMLQSPSTADRVYHDKLFGGFYKNGDSYYWSDPKNYYEQNWGWFGTALYGHRLANLWPVGQVRWLLGPSALSW